MPWTRDEAQALAKQILAASKAPECNVTLSLERNEHTRFAANDVTTAGTALDLRITITSRREGRSGTVTLSETEPAALARAVARSEELMAVAPPDPETVDPLPPQEYPVIDAGYDDGAARTGPAQRAAGVKLALDKARATKLDASGFFETDTTWTAIAGKTGLFGFHRSTQASFSTTMRTADGTGSGWAGDESPRVAELHPAELVSRAARKAEASRSPRDLPPGLYTVILEPQAVADLFSAGLGFALAARSAEEGRSYFSKQGGGTRIGEKVFHESVNLVSDPFDARRPGRPWVGGGGGGGGGFGFGGLAGGSWGLPARKVTWVENGVLQNLSVDRYWAKKTGRQPVPFAGGLVLGGGKGTVEDLIAGCERGLVVTRFWYIRSVNAQTMQLTGLTRDGVFLVEKGKVAGPVNNFRFNESPATVLKNVEGMSAATRAGNLIVPAIRASGFNFSSKSDAV